MHTPKTIITYLVDGNPQGIKTVELSNRVGKAIFIPRAKLKDAKVRSECHQPAIYFLFGNDGGDDLAYVGEAESLMSRLTTHAQDSKKDFWTHVVAFISKDNNLTKADVKFLESEAISRAKGAGNFVLQNSVTPLLNNLPEYQEATMREFLDNIDVLVSGMGYPILKSLDVEEQSDAVMYFCESKGIFAKGVYTADGFVILKGSAGSNKEAPSFTGKAKTMKVSLLERGMIENRGKDFVFLSDVVCSSPSLAGSLVRGASTNGWIVWKDKDGYTLDENERRDLGE